MFDEQYKTNTSYWGDEPSSSIRDYAPYFRRDTILDIGAGDGRNTLYLASLGFRVSALDISRTGLQNLMQKAKDGEVEALITPIIADFVQYEPEKSYDNIITNFALHFVGSANIQHVLEKIATATAPGGLAIINDFTPNGPLAKKPENYITPEILQDFYETKSWEIIQNHIYTTKTKALDANGKPFEQESVEFVARKPRS